MWPNRCCTSSRPRISISSAFELDISSWGSLAQCLCTGIWGLPCGPMTSRSHVARIFTNPARPHRDRNALTRKRPCLKRPKALTGRPAWPHSGRAAAISARLRAAVQARAALRARRHGRTDHESQRVLLNMLHNSRTSLPQRVLKSGSAAQGSRIQSVRGAVQP
eukprot:SAG31_NODE_1751_length_7353_cov_6.874552_8_plen_164_part_00